MKASEKAHHKEAWQQAYKKCGEYELDGRGENWRRKSVVLKTYMTIKGVSKATADRHWKQFAMDMFENAQEGSTRYIRLKGAKA